MNSEPLILVAGLFVAGCFCHGEIAKHPVAQSGFDHCEPVIQAIERFRADTGGYPTRLSALVPTYLGALPSTPEPTSSKAPVIHDVFYRKTSAGFLLSFRFLTCSANVCEYQPRLGWSCRGNM